MDEVAQLLGQADLDGLLGRDEDAQLEAKSEGYDLDSPAQRYELAKDIVAFANAAGGHLVLGVATARAADRDTDVLESLNLLPGADFPATKYVGVIKEYVYPSVLGLQVDFIAPDDQDQGLGVITVPPQDQDRGPFVILKVVEEGDDLRHIVVGYAERNAGHNEPVTPKLLQQRLRKGSDGISQRLGRLEEKVDEVLGILVPAEPGDQKVDLERMADRVSRLIEGLE